MQWNITVKWLKLLFHVWKFLVQTLTWKQTNLTEAIRGFPESLLANAGTALHIMLQSLQHPFQFFFTNHPTIQCYFIRYTENLLN